MLEYLKFSIGGFFEGYKTIKLWNNDKTATYEVIRSGLMEEMEPGTREPIENHDWLSEWDNLHVNEWDKEYLDSGICDGTQWELDYREYGKTRRRIYGSNAYPQKWYKFLEWLDLLMPDMEFISPNQLDAVMFLYHGTGINGIEEEQLFINRTERTVLLKKGTISDNDNSNIPVYVKSSHSYDFSDAEEIMMEMMYKCERYFQENNAETYEESDKRPPYLTIELTYHNGTKRREVRSIDDCRSEDWGVFMGGIKKYVSDVYSVLLYMFTENSSKRGKYMYCKVRFRNSQRLYSYRADDESLKVGDVVDVPVGSDGNVSQATIENIGYYDKEDAPYPPEKTKFIIGKHDGGNSKLTIERLRQILIDNNVYKGNYSLSEDEPPMCETTLCIRRQGSKWEYYTSERNIKINAQLFQSEDEACRALLEDMAYGHRGLRQYL